MTLSALILTLMIPFFARANETPWIVGNWEYFMKVYQNVEMPKSPNDPNYLKFDFTLEGQSRLYWGNTELKTHCNRLGEYKLEGELLVDKVTWVDPENTFGCGNDPDMQLGKVTRTAVFQKNGFFYLVLNLGNEPLYYVWKKRE